MHFTLWLSAIASTGGHTEIGWPAFLAFISSPAVAADKSALEGWSPCKFTGDARSKANAESVSCVVLDDDASGLPFEVVTSAWNDLAGVVHTSFSHTPEHPKYRIVLRLSRDVSADEHARIWSHVRARAVTAGQAIDEATKDASRLWYVPARREGAPYAWVELAGKPLDIESILSAVPAEVVDVTTTSMPPRAPAGPGDRRAAMALALGAAWPAKGTRHQAQLALAGALRADGWEQGEALIFLRDVCRAAGDEQPEKRAATIAHTWGLPPGAPMTSWTRLKSYVDPVLVDAARTALKPNADADEQLLRRLAEHEPGPANSPTTPDASPGLGFEFGAWDKEPPPIAFLVDGLVPRSSVGMFYGRADSLKTWILYSIGDAVASGRPWLGRFPVTKGKVGIVDFETGRANMHRRLFMLGAGANPNLGGVSFAHLKPNDPEFWLLLAKEHLDLVIIDSLRKANPGADENDSDEAIVPLSRAAEFAEWGGCTVIFIHHARKATADGWPEFRGSAAIEDQVDCAYAIRMTDETSAERKAVEIRCTKPGDMRTPPALSVSVAFDDASRKATLTYVEPEAVAGRPVDSMTNLGAAVLLALASGPIRGGYRCVADKLGLKVSSERVRRALKLLEEQRKIVRLDDGYELDDDARRTARVRAVVDTHLSEAWLNSPTSLAKEACVTVDDVHRLEVEKVIIHAEGRDSGGWLRGMAW